MQGIEGSQASTPKMHGSLKLALPARARNYNNQDSERHNSLNLPYGEPKILHKATTMTGLQNK